MHTITVLREGDADTSYRNRDHIKAAKRYVEQVIANPGAHVRWTEDGALPDMPETVHAEQFGTTPEPYPAGGIALDDLTYLIEGAEQLTETANCFGRLVNASIEVEPGDGSKVVMHYHDGNGWVLSHNRVTG